MVRRAVALGVLAAAVLVDSRSAGPNPTPRQQDGQGAVPGRPGTAAGNKAAPEHTTSAAGAEHGGHGQQAEHLQQIPPRDGKDITLAALERAAPNHDQPRWSWVSWDSAVATLLWVAASPALSL
jgi:hypothetical protein